jgi:hypothetical protein
MADLDVVTGKLFSLRRIADVMQWEMNSTTRFFCLVGVFILNLIKLTQNNMLSGLMRKYAFTGIKIVAVRLFVTAQVKKRNARTSSHSKRNNNALYVVSCALISKSHLQRKYLIKLI